MYPADRRCEQCTEDPEDLYTILVRSPWQPELLVVKELEVSFDA
jgi:hypothetical protein